MVSTQLPCSDSSKIQCCTAAFLSRIIYNENMIAIIETPADQHQTPKLTAAKRFAFYSKPTLIWWLAMVISSLVMAIIGYWYGISSSRSPAGELNPAAGSARDCTMEAKICPDGSAVGRSGPNCEFAPCPGE